MQNAIYNNHVGCHSESLFYAFCVIIELGNVESEYKHQKVYLHL
jgi:hypothetical protein